MKKLFCFFLITFLISCNSTKKVEQAILSGDYYSAIHKALDQIAKARKNNKTEEQKILLQKAFDKYQTEQLEHIAFLEKDQLSDNLSEIYYTYKELTAVQNAIKPVLPLYTGKKKLKFELEDISNEFLNSKERYVNQLYNQAIELMKVNQKPSYREAFYTFKEIDIISPGFKDSNVLSQEAKSKGTDMVIIKSVNATEMIIPKRLEKDILDLNLNTIKDEWLIFHTSSMDNVQYRYQINLIFENINFSPDQIHEKEEDIEKVIQITEKQLDRDGKVIKDENGKDVTYTRNVKTEGVLNTITQSKLVNIGAQVEYFDLLSNQQMKSYKLDSQFVFENKFAIFDGDERGLTEEQLELTKGVLIPFPTNEQMLFDAASDVKNKFKSILNRYSLN